MLKVDTIYGDDNNFDCFKTLAKAIEVSRTGDTISLMPGTYDSFQVRSKTTNFELKIQGSGSNTVCSQSNFDGYFDITYENLKMDISSISSSSSNFIFRDIKFVNFNTMNLSGYIPVLNDNPHNYIIFDRCTFGRNFQIITTGGDYVISFINCNISGQIPLIFAKSGNLTIKISSTNIDYPILMNKNAFVEIQYTCCNFTCPLYQGKECLICPNDTLRQLSPVERTRSSSIIFDQTKGSDNIDRSIEYEKELYAAIVINSDLEGNEEIPIHKFTKLVVNKGKSLLYVTFPFEASNGHIVSIYSYGPVEIKNETYDERIIKYAWIYNHGWIKLPV